MTYNQQTGHAEYSGDAQLWQGATSIRAEDDHARRGDRQPDGQGHRAIGHARRGEEQLEVRGRHDGEDRGRDWQANGRRSPRAHP